MNILGLSCDYHDAAAAVVIDGEVAAAAEQERFSRIKHDSSLPVEAVAAVLEQAGITAEDLDVVVFHEKPLVVLGRVLAARQQRGIAALNKFRKEMPTLLGTNLMIGYRVERMLRSMGATKPPRLQFSEHHLSHASAAFFPSPFTSAAIVTIDGIGEWTTATIGHGVRHRVDLLEEQRYPDSLGLLYSLITHWCGFEPNDGEYKLMGLAPYGEPTMVDQISEFAELDSSGAVTVDRKVVGWWGRPPQRLDRLTKLLGPPRSAGAELTQRDLDLARSIQAVTEDAVLRMARRANDLTGERALCLAGGVALNCVANGRLLDEGTFDSVWIQPAAGDAGSAVGAALWYWYEVLGNLRDPSTSTDADGMNGAQLGPAYAPDEVAAWLEAEGVAHERVTDSEERCKKVARMLADGQVIGWFEGRMEFGPRALGHRSILADPRSTSVQKDINMRVKGRESFRPFAPAVLWEYADEWFDITLPSPYMLRTCKVAETQLLEVESEPIDVIERVQVPRSTIPACTHIDGSARVQTVHRETNPLFHQLISEFRQITDCPVLLNTSFNRAGEPVVCTPDDALESARAAQLDSLIIEDCIVPLGELDPQ